VTAIWGTDPHGQWNALTPAAYPAEAALHDLVQQAPQMLPLAGSPRLTVLGREVRLGNGYADLIAVESTGRLVIIEVKLAGNAESRRAVVAQVLSYAGYLQGLDPDQLENQILGPCLKTARSVLAAVQADDQQHALDSEAFKQGLTRLNS
jgi:RecB family endonuclease NucS